MDFFHNIFSSSLVRFRIGVPFSSLVFRGVTTLLNIACLHDPLSKLRMELPSSDDVEDFGLLPTFRNLEKYILILLNNVDVDIRRNYLIIKKMTRL